MMVSPEEASEMAYLMVLQAVVEDMQLLLSFPFTPSTYHVVLARAVEVRARNEARSSLKWLGFTTQPSVAKVASGPPNTVLKEESPISSAPVRGR